MMRWQLVQDFDPIGVGARDLRECLLLQLKAFDPQNTLRSRLFLSIEASASESIKRSGARH